MASNDVVSNMCQALVAGSVLGASYTAYKARLLSKHMAPFAGIGDDAEDDHLGHGGGGGSRRRGR